MGFWLLLFALGCVGCDLRESKADAARAAKSISQPGDINTAVDSKTEATKQVSRECAARINEIRAEAPLPGAPGIENQRAILLARAKAEPILFLRTPEWQKPNHETAHSFREHLQNSKHYWDALRFQLQHFAMRPDIGADVLLKDGYLYAEQPELAYSLGENVRAEHVSRAARIWIMRGERVFFAKRSQTGEYVYEDGPGAGRRVSLLHLDRIGSGEIPEPLHVDLRSLRARLHFERMDVERIVPAAILATLHYGRLAVTSVLKRTGARLELECEDVPAEDRQMLDAIRAGHAARQRAMQLLRAAMHQQVVEQLSFDEPRREEGDEDGKLRAKWQTAYLRGQHSFRHNEVVYDVFDRRGHPRPPQVCVDFLTDTLERTSGTWWNDRKQPRERVLGRLDFTTFEELRLRRVPNFIEFARAHSQWFEVFDLQDGERIPLGQRPRFFAWLAASAGRFAVGDMVIIKGYTPKDSERVHYHSFFVYETDPVSGVPIAVVGNAETPHIWTLESESRRTPRRAIWHQLRIKQEFFDRYLPSGQEAPNEPPPLVEEPL